MRFTSLLVGLAAIGFAQSAWAGPVSVAPVAVSSEFEADLHDRLGPREGVELRDTVAAAVSRALVRHGATVTPDAPIVVETTIIGADPNRPTLQQVFDRPGLDSFRSISIGGAELHAVIRGADGQVLTEVNHRRYDRTFADLTGGETTWTEAHIAIRQFAEKVANAYAATGQ
jgi:hypothetical protein